tara:strand:- start:92 stop:280 length:189 start_codon:yes stop_codon:yes gene_type:complete
MNYKEIIHVKSGENNRECWITGDGQAHYDRKTAASRQLDLFQEYSIKELQILRDLFGVDDAV